MTDVQPDLAALESLSPEDLEILATLTDEERVKLAELASSGAPVAGDAPGAPADNSSPPVVLPDSPTPPTVDGPSPSSPQDGSETEGPPPAEEFDVADEEVVIETFAQVGGESERARMYIRRGNRRLALRIIEQCHAALEALHLPHHDPDLPEIVSALNTLAAEANALPSETATFPNKAHQEG